MGQLSDAFFSVAKRESGRQRPFLATLEKTVSYDEAGECVMHLAARLAPFKTRSVGIRGTTIATMLLTLALDVVGCRIVLVPGVLAAKREFLDGLGIVAVLSEFSDIEKECPAARSSMDGQHECGEQEIVLFTSGTTGVPKAVMHHLPTLLAGVHRSVSLGDARWLFLNEISSFAGLQVFLHAVLNGGTISLAPLASTPLEQALRLALATRVTHISATPTFFRFLLGAAGQDDIAQLRPMQITLGGEVVDQTLLDRLSARFSESKITHIYASSEMGPCFSVHDRRAGFPASLLTSDALPVRIRVADGELMIKPKGRAFNYLNAAAGMTADGYFATGDLVERAGDRYVFVGRSSERINVGGRKVAPAEVEAILLTVPGVDFARVYGAPSSLLGQLVKADIVVDPSHTQESVRKHIHAVCRDRLAEPQRPRLLNFVRKVELLENGKIKRA